MTKLKSNKPNIQKSFITSKLPLIFVIIFALAGVALLLNAFAANPFAAIEPESGSLSGTASIGSDPAASGGKYIQFNSPSGDILPFKATGNSDILPSTLVFDDEFNGTSLDLHKWQPNWLGSNDTAKTKGSNSSMLNCEDPAQVSLSGGYLILSLIQKSCAASNGSTYTYASGLVNSQGPSASSPRFTFKSGYAEAQMDLPPGSGACYNWPGFWTDGVANGVSWPVFLESDVMECLGGSPVATVHAGPSTGNDAWKKTIGNIGSKSGTHRFAFNFQPSSSISCSGSTPDPVRLTYYYDGVRLGSPYDVCIKNTGQYLIFQNDLGPNSLKNVPNSTKIDYVRVWR